MKLAIVSPYAPRFLGLGNYLKALLPSLSASPAVEDVVVLADRSAQAASSPGRRVRIEPCWDADSPAALAHILAGLARESPDVVWFNSSLMLGNGGAANLLRLMAPAAAARQGRSVLVTLHNLMESTSLEQLKAGRSPVHRWAGRLATRRQFAAHRVCFTLDRYVQLARAHYGVQNAVHVPHHVFAPPRRHRVAKRGTRLLYFGLQAPFKGVDVLLDAFHAARLALPDLRLDLAGGRHPRFGGIAAARESGAGIAWHGQVSDEAADRLVAGADVVVVPSLASPGASSVIHRAAAQGKAIVASDLPDYRALAAEQGFAVEFCPPGDGQALAEAIHRVCLSSGLRLRAREVNLAASARVTPAVIAGRYVALFQSALAPAASPAMALTRAPVELAAS